MRLGQAVGEIRSLLSDDEIQVCLVPLTEAEHLQCVGIITDMDAPDNMVGAMARDRRNVNEILLRAIREPLNPQERMFNALSEMTELLEIEDINFLFDEWGEMMEQVSPNVNALTDEEIEALKKVFEQTQWKELSGRSLYALKRLLSTLGYTLLPDNSLGSTSTAKLTTRSENPESTNTVFPSSDDRPVRSAEIQ